MHNGGPQPAHRSGHSCIIAKYRRSSDKDVGARLAGQRCSCLINTSIYLRDSLMRCTVGCAHLRPKNSSGTNHIFVMANEGSPGSARLINAGYEAKAVASIFGVSAFLGDQATTANLRSHAGDYEILHVASHIKIDSRNPRSSTIGTDGTEAEEGPLQLNQVATLDLRKTNLVVLSGCESQQGRRSRGDDIQALSRAFMVAGSSSVLASLWSVDEATERLMVAFYTRLKAGLSKAEALRAAENDIRKQYPNPYYWNGFILAGDPGSARTFNLVAAK